MPDSEQHTGFSATAIRMIDKHGRSMLLLNPVSTGPAYNPGITWGETAICAVSIDYSLADVAGDQIQLQDKQLLIAASGLAITTSMRIRDGLINYEIVSVRLIQPGLTPILYTVQVRV